MIRHAKIAGGIDPADPTVIGKSKWNDDHFGPKFTIFYWSCGHLAHVINPVAGITALAIGPSGTIFDFTNVTKVGFFLIGSGNVANTGRLFAMGNNGAPDAWDYLGNVAQTPGVVLTGVGATFEAEVVIRPSMQVPGVRVRLSTEGGNGNATGVYSMMVWAR
jgi:hypothetical protein